MQGSKRGALASRELNTPTQCNVDFCTALTSPDSELRHVSRVRITSMTRSARRLRFLGSREGTYSYLSNYLPSSFRNFPFHRVSCIMNPMSLLCPSAMGNSFWYSRLNTLAPFNGFKATSFFKPKNIEGCLQESLDKH